MNIQLNYKNIITLLEQYGNPEEYEKIRYYFNHTPLKMYGVSLGPLRKIAEERKKKLADENSREVISLITKLYCGLSFDERMLGSIILDENSPLIKHLTEKDFNVFIRQVDNWAVSDFLSDVLGQWVLTEPKRGVKYLKRLIESNNLWSRRQALVASFYINFKQKEINFSDLVIDFVEKTKHEKKNPMIVKAISWALRGLTKYHSEILRKYLKEQSATLPSLARREATKKLETGRKMGKQPRRLT